MDEIKDNGIQIIDDIYCLNIIGEIEGHVILPPQSKTTKYEHVIPALIEAERDTSKKGILIILNTMGGDVEAGLAIAEMISSLTKPTVSLVLGGSHSIGVPLAVSADYSFIVPSATMTLHPVRINGTVLSVPQSFNYLERMQERVVEFVVKNSHISKEDFMKFIMNTSELANDMGSVLLGEDAVKSGLIDAIGGISDALLKLEQMQKERP